MKNNCWDLNDKGLGDVSISGNLLDGAQSDAEKLHAKFYHVVRESGKSERRVERDVYNNQGFVQRLLDGRIKPSTQKEIDDKLDKILLEYRCE